MKTQQWEQSLSEYTDRLFQEGKADRTVRKYVADIRRFLAFAARFAGEERDVVRAYAAYLQGEFKASTCNSYLISLNRFLCFQGRAELCVPLKRLQSRFSLDNELTLPEYKRLLHGFLLFGDIKYYLIVKTLAGMGLRVGELPFVTPQALGRGWAEIAMKGKVRQIFFPVRLQGELTDYCRRFQIASGPVFRNRRGDGPVDSSLVWRHLQKAAQGAGVDREKAFPHNLRHLFARVYMETYGDIVDLADLLGHSSIETTRIYTRTSSAEKIRRISAMSL